MTKPTAASYRADPRINWVSLGLPAGGSPDSLEAEINMAWAYVEEVTGLQLEPISSTDNKAYIAYQAVRLRTIQQAVQGTGTFASQSNNQNIKSFAVPGYSETRGDSSKISIDAFFFNPWTALEDLLWLLATQEKKDEALAKKEGEVQPFSDVREIDWFYPVSPF